jgi:hypothetical protein
VLTFDISVFTPSGKKRIVAALISSMPYEILMNRFTTVFAPVLSVLLSHRRQFSRGARSAAVRSCWRYRPSGTLVAQPQIEAPPNNYSATTLTAANLQCHNRDDTSAFSAEVFDHEAAEAVSTTSSHNSAQSEMDAVVKLRDACRCVICGCDGRVINNEL